MSFNIYKVGEQIASLRKNKNLTQAELGERLNVSSQAVSNPCRRRLQQQHALRCYIRRHSV